MKVEIGESLVCSYLKHVTGCRLVQTNWKVSGNWVVVDSEKQRAMNLFTRIRAHSMFQNVFKNSSFEQLIKQAEIDVLGIDTSENEIYGVDIAFHTAGVNYGDTVKTVEIIVKKIIRTVFILQTYFNDYEKFHSYFITPKANPSQLKGIEIYIDELQKILEDKVNIEFIANDQFYRGIVDPLIEKSEKEHDTGELFLRSLKLLQLDKNKVVAKTGLASSKTPSNLTIKSKAKNVNGMKIGQFVQETFRKAYAMGFITTEEIIKLQSLEYSKTTFGANYEILRNINREISDEGGINRYYVRELFCGDYKLTSQWFERQFDQYMKWLSKIGYKL